MTLANVIGGFIVVLIGVTLIPEVANNVDTARYFNSNTSTPTNVSTAQGTILNLTILFFAVGVMAAGVAIATQGLKQAGMF